MKGRDPRSALKSESVRRISASALKAIADCPQYEGRDLVFGTPAGPFSWWSKAEAQLDEAIVAGRAERLGAKAPELVPWRLHDIRRAVAIQLGDLGGQPHIIEAVLNHVSGHKVGVAGIYNRATYAPEKAAALTLWANHPKSPVAGELR
jgi:hypothetical protein